MNPALSAQVNLDHKLIKNSTNQHTSLRGVKLLLARLAYFALFILLAGVYILGLPSQFAYSTSGFVGVTATVSQSGEVILLPLPNQQAAKAGIRAGDVLLAIDGVPIEEITPRTTLFKTIMGPVGTPITLDVRTQDGSVRAYTLTRDVQIFEDLGISPTAYALYFTLLDSLIFIGFTLPALIIYRKKSADWLGMFVSLTLILIAVNNTGEMPALISNHPQWWWINRPISQLFYVAFFLLLFIFPDGKFVPTWTRTVGVFSLLWSGLNFLPVPYRSWPVIAFPLTVIGIILPIIGIYAQTYRYRKVSTQQERQQTKWVIFGLTLATLGLYAYMIPQMILNQLQQPSPVTFTYRLIGQTLFQLTLLAVPVTFMISMLRYRLYDIDLIINRTLVYVPLTAILAGQYSASISLSQRLFIAFTGQKSDTAIVLTTLFLASVFTPLKNFLQSKVDKYFKENPDPHKQLEGFARQFEKRVFPVETAVVARQLLEAAFRAFDPTSAAVYWTNEPNAVPLHVTVNWDNQAQIEVPLRKPGNGNILGRLSLGPRKNGDEYSYRDLQSLYHTAQIMTAVIMHDQGLAERFKNNDPV